MLLRELLAETKHKKHHRFRHSVYPVYRGGYPIALDTDGDYDGSTSGESEADNSGGDA